MSNHKEDYHNRKLSSPMEETSQSKQACLPLILDIWTKLCPDCSTSTKCQFKPVPVVHLEKSWWCQELIRIHKRKSNTVNKYRDITVNMQCGISSVMIVVRINCGIYSLLSALNVETTVWWCLLSTFSVESTVWCLLAAFSVVFVVSI